MKMRVGQCDGCVGRPGVEPGQCCTRLRLRLNHTLNPDEKKWVELHPGLTVDGDMLTIATPCGALEDGKCTLHGKPERPDLCRLYPAHESHLMPGCSYQFVDIKDLK